MKFFLTRNKNQKQVTRIKNRNQLLTRLCPSVLRHYAFVTKSGTSTNIRFNWTNIRLLDHDQKSPLNRDLIFLSMKRKRSHILLDETKTKQKYQNEGCFHFTHLFGASSCFYPICQSRSGRNGPHAVRIYELGTGDLRRLQTSRQKLEGW